jgi:undecaprenyl diphosphate synthase
MDGNRRWAQTHGLMPWYGHKEGVEATYRVINFCLEKGIKHLSLFTFAIQNFKRSPQETNHIFDMMLEHAQEVLESMLKKNVRIQFIGDRTLFPKKLTDICENIEQKTSASSSLHLYLFFCYGGQEDIIETTKKIALQVAQGKITPDQIDAKLFEQSLWTANVPSPDLIIRTGGVNRLSNFMLYQAAYAELYFLDCMWPELAHEHLELAMEYFKTCKRNFGV